MAVTAAYHGNLRLLLSTNTSTTTTFQDASNRVNQECDAYFWGIGECEQMEFAPNFLPYLTGNTPGAMQYDSFINRDIGSVGPYNPMTIWGGRLQIRTPFTSATTCTLTLPGSTSGIGDGVQIATVLLKDYLGFEPDGSNSNNYAVNSGNGTVITIPSLTKCKAGDLAFAYVRAGTTNLAAEASPPSPWNHARWKLAAGPPLNSTDFKSSCMTTWLWTEITGSKLPEASFNLTSGAEDWFAIAFSVRSKSGASAHSWHRRKGN